MHSSRGDYNASREHLLQCVEKMRIDLDIPDAEFFKAIGVPEDHYRVLTTHRGKGFKLDAIHDMLNGLERFSMNDDRKLTVETFKMKYGYDPILLSSVHCLNLPIRPLTCFSNNYDFSFSPDTEWHDPIEYIGQLLKYTPNRLKKLPNFGPKSLRIVVEELARFGLKLPEQEDVDNNFPKDVAEIHRLVLTIPESLYDLNERLIDEKL